MHRARVYVVALFCICLAQAPGSEVSGKITIEKRGNTPLVASATYDLRGVAVSSTAPVEKVSGGYDRVAIWLESSGSMPAPAVKAEMRQQNRHMKPDLLLVPVGSVVDFPNLDPIFHNIFSLSRTQSFDLGYYAEGHSRSIRFPHPGIVQVYCHVHPNMHGVIVVTPSRWFGKPAPDGTFSWLNVPAGNYRMCAWQRSAGLLRRKIVVPESGTVRVNMNMPDKDPEN